MVRGSIPLKGESFSNEPLEVKIVYFGVGAESGLFAASLLFAASSTFLTRAASLDDAASGKKVERAAKGKRVHVAEALSVPTPNDSFCVRRPKSARHKSDSEKL